jgi:hypothetical protein
MLERPGLLLSPWTLATPELPPVVHDKPRRGRARVRLIRDLATGEGLGFARWSGGSSSPLFSWLSRQEIEVFENEDASHLLTLVRPWGISRAWDVLDAEGRRIGKVFRNVVLESYGRRLATLQPSARYAVRRFEAARDTDLAVLEAQAESGSALRFSQALQDEPFSKMVLLGAALLCS